MLGKWVIVDEGEYFQVGVITDVLEVFILVRVRPVVGPSCQKLFCMSDLVEGTLSAIFDTEEELDLYLNWMEEPTNSKPKIVSLREPGKNHD